MNTDPTQDAQSLGIALRLAHAQIRDLRKQLAMAKEALASCMFGLSTASTSFEKQSAWERAKQALAKINENGESADTRSVEMP